MTLENIEQGLRELGRRLEILPEAEEPPPTTLQVIGRSQQEQDWQRLLFHFMNPEGAHGIEHTALEYVLKALAERDDIDYVFSRFDLEDVHVRQEVVTEAGRPDAILWSADDWFMCWELKVTASEGQDQTQRYVEVDSFSGIDLDKGDFPSDGQHYVYLAPAGVSPPTAPEFVHISWEWLAETLQDFIAESYGKHPARTTAQIEDFTDTIRNELTMTEYEENQRAKVELYIDHYDEIKAVQDAFTDRWDEFTTTWGRELAQQLDATELVEDPDVPEEYVAVKLTLDSGEEMLWTFRQGHQDWSWMFPREWWTTIDDGEPIFDPSSPQGRVGFLHRLDWNRDRALKDHELVFYLRNAPSGHDEFYNGFAQRFNDDDKLPNHLPTATTRPGVKSNVLEATYEINVNSHENFFDAYISALALAMEEHVVSNPELVRNITRLYDETVMENVTL